MELIDLQATYGKLNNSSLHLERGLNIIRADNESGKSTWVSFLGDMFYGIPTRDRSFLAHKTRYIPWEGASMSGAVRFHFSGRDYHLSRSPSPTGIPFGRSTLTYTNTNIPLSNQASSNPGEFFFSVPREVFERTAYISQNSIHVSQTPDLEKKISSLVSTGDEVSFTDAHTILKKQMRQRQYNNSGEIPGLKRQLTELQSKIDRANEINDQIQSLNSSISSIQAQLDHIQKDVQDSYELQKAETSEHYRRLLSEISSAERSINQLQAAFSSCNKSLLDKLDHSYEQLYLLQEQIHKIEREISDLNEKLRSNDPDGEEYTPNVQESGVPVYKPRWHIPALSFFLFILSLVCILYVSTPFYQIIIAAFSICCFIFSSAYIFYSFRKYHKQFNILTPAHNNIEIENKQEIAYKQTSLENLGIDFQHQWSAFVDLLASAGKPDITSAQDAQDALAELHSCQDELLHKKEQLQRLLTEQQYLKKELDKYNSTSAIYTFPVDTHSSLTELQSQLHTLSAKRDVLIGELASFGSVTSLQSMHSALTERIKAIQFEYEALQIADDALSVANTDLESRFSPILSEQISDIFRTITKGKYQSVFINKDFEVTVIENGCPTPRDIRLLSQGTIDLLYFSLRMALCLQLYSEDNTPPLIFDDAFVSFDDQRLHAILDYLLEISKYRQILLFTCHARESEYLHGKNGVTSIFL